MNIPTIAALTLALWSGAAWARDAAPARTQGQRRQAQVPHPGATRHEDGIVMAVDAARGRLTLKTANGKVHRFAVARAKIDAVEGKTLSLADIAVGDEIAVSYNRTVRGKDVIAVLRLRRAAKP